MQTLDEERTHSIPVCASLRLPLCLHLQSFIRDGGNYGVQPLADSCPVLSTEQEEVLRAFGVLANTNSLSLSYGDPYVCPAKAKGLAWPDSASRTCIPGLRSTMFSPRQEQSVATHRIGARLALSCEAVQSQPTTYGLCPCLLSTEYSVLPVTMRCVVIRRAHFGVRWH